MSVASVAGNGAGEAYTTSLQGELLGHEIIAVAVAEVAQLAEGHAAARIEWASASSDRRGRRPHHVGTDGVGTWEAHAGLGREAEGGVARDDRSGVANPCGWRIGVSYQR